MTNRDALDIRTGMQATLEDVRKANAIAREPATPDTGDAARRS